MDTFPNIISIRLQPDGFLFSSYNILEDQSFTSRKFTFTSDKGYLEQLEESLLNDETLNERIKEYHATIVTPRYILCPANIETSLQDEMFHFSCSSAKHEEKILHQPIGNTGICIAYAIEKDTLNFLERNFQNVLFHHPVATLHNYFVEKSRFGNNAKMLVHASDNEVMILVYSKGKLQMSNLYRTQSVDNAVYYILNTWTQLKLDVRQDVLQLAGNKALLSSITEKVAPFIENIVPAVFPTQLFKLGQDTLSTPWDISLLALYATQEQ